MTLLKMKVTAKHPKRGPGDRTRKMTDFLCLYFSILFNTHVLPLGKIRYLKIIKHTLPATVIKACGATKVFTQ